MTAQQTGDRICPHCGTLGQPQSITPGSDGVTVLLWLFGLLEITYAAVSPSLVAPILAEIFLMIALTYTVWRTTTRHQACPTCLQPRPIDPDTPRGRKLREEYGLDRGKAAPSPHPEHPPQKSSIAVQPSRATEPDPGRPRPRARNKARPASRSGGAQTPSAFHLFAIIVTAALALAVLFALWVNWR